MKIKELTLSGLALIGICVLASCGNAGQQYAGSAAPTVAVMTVEKGDIQFQSSYPATIQGKTDIAIRPQVTGFITKVCVDEGQRVHRGQTLFILDQVQFQAAVDQAEANLNSAKTAVSTAKLAEENKRLLLEKNIISQTEWQMAANQLTQANAAVAQAEAALVTARKNLAYTIVEAPSDGIVGVIPNREGSLASPSSMQPLTTLSDISEVYAYFSLSEKDLFEMTNGGTTSIEAGIANMPEVSLQLVDGSIYGHTGKIATISGVIDRSTGAASVRALFPNPSGLLRSGNTGQVIIPRVAHDAIIIPQKATFELQDLRYVYTLNDSNITKSTRITVEPYNDGKSFAVTSGLNIGDRIVIEGIGTSVRQGMPIVPKTTEE